jgi:Mg-chelatase subunit ChlD
MTVHIVSPSVWLRKQKEEFEENVKEWVHGTYCEHCDGNERKRFTCENLTVGFEYLENQQPTKIAVKITNKHGGITELWVTKDENIFSFSPQQAFDVLKGLTQTWLNGHRDHVNQQEAPQRIAFGKSLPPRKEGDIVFIVDTTASREATWEKTKAIMHKMLAEFGEQAQGQRLRFKIITFGGTRAPAASDWVHDPEELSRVVSGVTCAAGQTQIVSSLRTLVDHNEATQPGAAILIGDAFEENMGELEAVAQALKERGTKVSTFLEGGYPAAQRAFRSLAQTTGGGFQQFTYAIVNKLEDWCRQIIQDAFSGGGGRRSTLSAAPRRKGFGLAEPAFA